MWRPTATLETLRARAELFRAIREFFETRGVMEVDTPALSQHGTVDRHIESFGIFSPSPVSRPPPRLAQVPAALNLSLDAGPSPSFWLHTSPEFGIKRLLAAGIGPIYQLGHVFRAEQAGRLHNPEFMMLEWYRPGWDHHRLMDEVEDFFKAVIPAKAGIQKFERFTYQAAFNLHAGLDPFTASLSDLQNNLTLHGVALPANRTPEEELDRDFWLDLWMGAVVGPRLGLDAPCFVYDFPASQAALARVRDEEPPVAERFELVWKGVELANGFHELTDAAEQRARFESDRHWRLMRGLKTPPYDTNLLAALESGLPQSAGVALGFDRLLMLKLGLKELAQVLPFGSDSA